MDNIETLKLPSYACELCLKNFSQKSSRNRHIREQHLQPGSYKCKQCGLRFSKKYNLQMHVDHVHPKIRKVNGKHFNCSQCTCEFSTPASLKKHETVYHTDTIKQNTPNFIIKQKQETDPQILANSVLKQLKQLQNDIQTNERANMALVMANELIPVERNVEREVVLKDNLYPGKEFKLIKTQTIKRTNGLTYFICGFCSKEFCKTYNYLRHLRVHTHVRPFICVLCKKSFPTTAQLKTHCLIHKFSLTFGIYHKLYKCPNCQESFSAVQKLEKHLSNNSSQCNVTFECPQCLKSFRTLTSILRHKHDGEDKELQLLKTILPRPQYVANMDGSEVQTLKYNLDVNTCNLCSLQFSCKILLKQHKKRHEDLNKYKCFECKQSYATKCSLKIHLKSHKKDGARDRTYKCIYCDNKFTTAQNCRSHMLTHLKQLIKTPTESLDNNAALNRIPIILKNSHEDKTLTTETYFIKNIKEPKIAQNKSIDARRGLQHKCCECGKSFRYQAWLKKHFSYKHSTEYSYKCLECSRKFRTKQSLKTHMVTHKKDRDKFNCQVCARQYASKKSLQLHLRIHTEEKPFKCKRCFKEFRTSGHLIQHKKSNHF